MTSDENSIPGLRAVALGSRMTSEKVNLVPNVAAIARAPSALNRRPAPLPPELEPNPKGSEPQRTPALELPPDFVVFSGINAQRLRPE